MLIDIYYLLKKKIKKTIKKSIDILSAYCNCFYPENTDKKYIKYNKFSKVYPEDLIPLVPLKEDVIPVSKEDFPEIIDNNTDTKIEVKSVSILCESKKILDYSALSLETSTDKSVVGFKEISSILQDTKNPISNNYIIV